MFEVAGVAVYLIWYWEMHFPDSNEAIPRINSFPWHNHYELASLVPYTRARVRARHFCANAGLTHEITLRDAGKRGRE